MTSGRNSVGFHEHGQFVANRSPLHVTQVEDVPPAQRYHQDVSRIRVGGDRLNNGFLQKFNSAFCKKAGEGGGLGKQHIHL